MDIKEGEIICHPIEEVYYRREERKGRMEGEGKEREGEKEGKERKPTQRKEGEEDGRSNIRIIYEH